jgi:hypothetical protein
MIKLSLFKTEKMIRDWNFSIPLIAFPRACENRFPKKKIPLAKHSFEQITI